MMMCPGCGSKGVTLRRFVYTGHDGYDCGYFKWFAFAGGWDHEGVLPGLRVLAVNPARMNWPEGHR